MFLREKKKISNLPAVQCVKGKLNSKVRAGERLKFTREGN